MRFFLVILSSFFLISCDRLLPPRVFIGQSPNPNNQAPNVLPQHKLGEGLGSVQCDNRQFTLDTFNTQLRLFLSTSQDPSQLRPVGCENSHKGGMHFSGKVFFKDAQGGPGKIMRINEPNQVLHVHPSSYINIHIDFADDTKLRPIKVPALDLVNVTTNTLADGKIQGRITFLDDKGEISLDGSIDKRTGVFKGYFHYSNHTSFSGNHQLPKGTIGVAKINACSFFNCGT